MESTYIRDTPSSRIRSATAFGGINRANGTPLGEWDKLNGFDLTAYPALRTCPPYARNSLPTGITGYTFRNGSIVYTVSDGIYINGAKTEISGLSSGEKTLVNIGAYIVILPDWKRVNIASYPIEVDSGGDENDIVGTVTEKNSNKTQPTVAIYKRWYMETPYGDDMTQSKKISRLHRGDSMYLIWTDADGNRQTRDIRVKNTSIFTKNSGRLYFRVEFDVSKLSTSYFYMADEQSDGSTSEKVYQNVTLTRSAIPDMDYVIEYNNRLWGCSSANHEIYCSKLGDPFQWGDYSGISTDSWSTTIGTDGDFTGVCVYNGCVLFFKEDCVHSVYGTKASNFTVTTYTVRGVQKGSSKSLCISEGLLYYKAPEGIFCFNGSASSRADMKLSCDITQTACGTADDRYIVMLMSDGTAYYYDKLHSVWYTRYLADAISAHNIGGKLYAVTMSDDGTMEQVLLTGADSMALRDGKTTFEAVTGELCRGELMSTSSYTRKVMHTVIKKLTMSLEEWHQKGVSAVNFALAVQYDGGDWLTVYSYDGTEETSDGNVVTLVPIIPMRCQRLRIKISGTLTASSRASTQPYLTLYGLFIDTEEASEIGGKH